MIRLGIVGYGHRMACFMGGPMKNVEPDFQVVGVVDPAEAFIRKRLADWGCTDQKEVPFYPDVATLVREGKPDGLLIGTNCAMHTPFAIQAAEYGLPLFLEKPVSTSMEQAVALEKAFRKSKTEVVVSFPLRVSPLCVRAQQAIESGEIGRPEHIAGLNYVPYGTVYYTPGSYQSLQGLFLQKATHDLDYMMGLMGSRVRRVGAMASKGRVFGGSKPAGLVCSKCDEAETCKESPKNRQRNGSASGKNKDHACVFSVDIGTPETGICEDSSSCVLEFESGATGVYTQVFFSRRDAGRRGSIVSGYDGTVSFDWYRNDITLVHHHKPFTDTFTSKGGANHFGGDDELASDFVDLIHGRIKRSRTPIETGLASVYACLAAKESSETGRFVEVRPVEM
ncbi:MAG: Gfo/Idh/MocA family oxidoreductase [Planctomycetota bacterium]|nr:Gfo/Idh/MocA family oxidoreductase [Planctomycetota bacterium]